MTGKTRTKAYARLCVTLSLAQRLKPEAARTWRACRARCQYICTLDVKSVFCVFGLGAGYTRICVYLFACDAGRLVCLSRLLVYTHTLAPTRCNACNDRCQRAAMARTRPRPWPRRWKRRLHPAGRGRGWGLPLEAWRSELTSPGVYLLFPEGGNKHQREGVYLAVYLVCICFQDKNTQIHAYPHPSPSVSNI